MARTFIRRTQRGEYTTPKTVLGFYWGVLAALEAGVGAVILVLSTQESLRYLVPWVLVFGAAVFVVVVAIVIGINLKAPMKLQLGEVTGSEFMQHEQMTQGDSIAGERVERLPASIARALPETTIPSSTQDAQESDK